MSKLIIIKGLPGSGKSTWSREYISKHKAVNICKDDLRKMMPLLNEGKVLEARNYLTSHYLKIGHDVIWSDTNLNPIHEETANRIVGNENKLIKEDVLGKDLHSSCYHVVEIKDFTNVPIETCIKQDLQRLDSVGKDVIMEMYYKWLCPKEEAKFVTTVGSLQDCYIVDIDGTIAETTDRSHYDYSEGAVLTDSPRLNVIETILSLRKQGNEIIFVSGRKDECKIDTRYWLNNHFGEVILHMRKSDDNRNDSIVKKEIYDEHINGKYNVLGVFDDRMRVIRMWEKEGLTVFNVGKGYEF